MSTADGRSVLIVDDDQTFRQRLTQAFVARGFEASQAAGLEDALRLARADSPEFAVVDLRLKADSGLDVVRGLREIDASTRIVVLTGFGSIATAVEAVRLGAHHYLTKPADCDDLIAAFERNDAEGAAVVPDQVPTLARIEWEHINRVLQDCGGNVSQAARLLGLHRRSLQRKLAKHPVPR